MGLLTQEDPIGIAGGLNLYGFANGDPINFTDPFGLNPCDEVEDETERASCEERAEQEQEGISQCRVAAVGFLLTAGSDLISLTGVGAATLYGIKGLRLAGASARAYGVNRSGRELWRASANLLQQSDHAYSFARASAAGAYTAGSEAFGAAVTAGSTLGQGETLQFGSFLKDITPVWGSVRAYNNMNAACEGR